MFQYVSRCQMRRDCLAPSRSNVKGPAAKSIEAGRRPRRAYLVAQRGTRGQWFVTREHLAEFLERRRPPAVRVGQTSIAHLGHLVHAEPWAQLVTQVVMMLLGLAMIVGIL